MKELEWSQHAKDMLAERQIREEWVIRAITTPDRSEAHDESRTHCIKAIPEYGGRFLRVVVNRTVSPNRVVTAFSDRRLGKKR